MTAVVVGFIVVGIILHVAGANGGNAVVSFVYDVAGWLVAPFKGVFSPGGEKARIAANWGLAAVVYAVAGALIAGLLAGMGGGTMLARRRTAVRRRRTAV